MRRLLALLLIAALAVPMIGGVLYLPPPGAADAPIHAHVSARYVADAAEVGDPRNLVTEVLLDYRALDTFGEVLVMFAAVLAVTAIASRAGRAGGRGAHRPEHARKPVPVSPVVSLVVRLMAPFVAAFGMFVIVNGHVLPGGGFQGGVVLGAMLMLLTIVRGREAVAGLLPAPALFWARGAAPLVFGLVALLGVAVSGWMLGMPGQSWLRETMLLGLELAIGIGAAAVLIGLFLALERD